MELGTYLDLDGLPACGWPPPGGWISVGSESDRLQTTVQHSSIQSSLVLCKVIKRFLADLTWSGLALFCLPSKVAFDVLVTGLLGMYVRSLVSRWTRHGYGYGYVPAMLCVTHVYIVIGVSKSTTAVVEASIFFFRR